MFKFKQKLLQPEQGFTLVEVLVAILVATLFVTVTMNMMVAAAMLKARARQYTAGINALQEDSEQVKYKASTYEDTSTTLSLPAAPSASSITVVPIPGTGYANNETLRVGSDSTNYTISSISGNTFNITPALAQAQPVGTTVVRTQRCGTTATPATQTTGYANGLSSNMPTPVGTSTYPVTISGPSVLGFQALLNSSNTTIKIQAGGTKLWLLRKATPKNKTPFNVLELYYAAVPELSNGTPSTSPVATLYTEVMPDAALKCP